MSTIYDFSTLSNKGKEMEEKAKDIPNCLAQQLSDKMEDINCLISSIPALDQLIEGLSRPTTND